MPTRVTWYINELDRKPAIIVESGSSSLCAIEKEYWKGE